MKTAVVIVIGLFVYALALSKCDGKSASARASETQIPVECEKRFQAVAACSAEFIASMPEGPNRALARLVTEDATFAHHQMKKYASEVGEGMAGLACASTLQDGELDALVNDMRARLGSQVSNACDRAHSEAVVPQQKYNTI